MAGLDKKNRVFISHAREDAEFVSQLSVAIENAFAGGIEVVAPAVNLELRASADITGTIVEAIRTAQVVLIVLSPASTNSPWVNFEVGSAIGAEVTVIPLCVGISSASIPAPLRGLQSVDLGTEAGFRRLFAALGDHCDLQPKSTSWKALHRDLTRSKLSSVTETELLKRVAGTRDANAFDDLLIRWRPEILRFASSFTRDSHEAEDIAMEVMLHVWQRADLLRSLESNQLRAYIRTSARRIAFHSARRARKTLLTGALDSFIEPISVATSSIEGEEWAGAIKRLTEALNDVSDRERQIISLRYFEDLSYDEIAELLDLPSATVRSHAYRAMKKLRKTFALARDA